MATLARLKGIGGLRDLAAVRQALSLPAAGSAADKATLARLDIDGAELLRD